MTDPAIALARRMIDRFGAPVPHSPATTELVCVDLSVRDVAAAFDLSAGTVQRYLSRLDKLGVRVSVDRRVYSLERLEEIESSAGTTPTAAQPNGASGNVVSAERTDAVGAFAALCDLVSADSRQLELAQGVAAQLLRDLAVSGRAEMRDRNRTRASERAVGARQEHTSAAVSGSRDQDLFNPMNSSMDESVEEESARTSRSAHRRQVRGVDVTLELLSPLVNACERLGLPGVTNSAQLAARLDSFDDAQIRFAVSKLLVEANNGLLKPVGKLANVAAEGSIDYFPADPPPVRLPNDPSEFVLPPADLNIASVVTDNETVRGEPDGRVDPAVKAQGLAMVRAQLGNVVAVDASSLRD